MTTGRFESRNSRSRFSFDFGRSSAARKSVRASAKYRERKPLGRLGTAPSMYWYSFRRGMNSSTDFATMSQAPPYCFCIEAFFFTVARSFCSRCAFSFQRVSVMSAS